MDHQYKVLVINPGSTSTKLALYVGEQPMWVEDFPVPNDVAAPSNSIFDQIEGRKKQIFGFLKAHSVMPEQIDVIASRGGGGGDLKSGAYLINRALVEHCYTYPTKHASSLGPIIAFDLMGEWNKPGYIYDGEGINEFNEFAVLSGLKQFPVTPGSHTLNAKAAARECAKRMGGRYEDYTFVVCHIGGGSSTSLHVKGKLIDSTSDGYSPERCGSMPMMAMIGFTRACYSGQYTLDEMMKMQMGGGGLVSYLGISDLREVERRITAGDREAAFYLDGMIYQQVKDIGAMAAVAGFEIDQIILTGGAAHSTRITDAIKKRVERIAPVTVMPGSLEMKALAQGALNAFLDIEKTHIF